MLGAFNGVISCGRVWRKMPESNIRSVASSVTSPTGPNKGLGNPATLTPDPAPAPCFVKDE